MNFNPNCEISSAKTNAGLDALESLLKQEEEEKQCSASS